MKNKNLFCYLVIFLFSFSYFFFLGNDNYLIADDTVFHTSNILVMSEEISFSNLIPDKIMPVLANDLGYGVNLFYPMFPHLVGAYLVKIFGLFNVGIVGVMKFIHFMVIFLSGIFMYKYIMKVFKNRKQAILSAILYQSMPYLFTDVFMRGAFNESFIFIYLPIIFLSFYYLFETNEVNKFYFCFVIGYSLLIYSHLVMTVYLTLFLILFLLVYYKKLFNIKVIKRLIIASLLILLITSNFWGPLLEHKLLNEYYIFNVIYKNSMVANIAYYLFPIKFFNTSPDYFLLFFISPICIIFIICSYIVFCQGRMNKIHKRVLFGIGIFLVSSMLIASSYFVWDIMPNLLKNIQFAWRLALFVAFGASVLGGYGIRLFSSRVQKILLVIVICCGVFSNYYLSSQLSYMKVDEDELLASSCCHLQWSYEYLSIYAKDNYLHLHGKSNDLNVEHIKIISNDVPDMEFEVFNINKSILVEFPRIFYFGYELLDEDGKKIDVYQNNFGLLEARIDKNGVYYLEYKGTLVDRITKALSLVGIVLFIFVSLKMKRGFRYGI